MAQPDLPRTPFLPALTVVRAWVLPVLLLVGAALLLRGTLHDRWLEVVWGVRDLGPEQWNSDFTRLRLWLDGAMLGLSALGAALLIRFGVRRSRAVVALALLGLGLTESDLLAPLLVGVPDLLERLSLLGVALALGVGLLERPGQRGRTSRPLLWGYGWLLVCTLIWTLTHLPLEGGGLPTPLFGSQDLAILWNELLRPAVRDLGMLLFLLCAALAWLERSPGALRSSVGRGLVFSGLTLSAAGVYAVVVGGVGLLLHAENSFWLGMVATALIAAGLLPARAALTRGVSRLLYGERDDPYALMQRLSAQLEGGGLRAALERALRSISEALRLPYVAVQLSSGELIEQGSARVGGHETLPLIAQGERIGVLEVARRSPREAFSVADLELLGTLARQLAALAHTWQLEGQLIASRETLVRAGEEERRRLRRDLHDGLGPSLSGLGLKLEAARILLARSPEKAAAHLDTLKLEVQESVAEVRRLVHDLRPPKLDDLGLRGSLSELLEGGHRAGLNVRLEAPDPLPALPAALEVAVYRIAQEALTNVQKHAQAQGVRLTLALEGACLTLTLEDDGVGLPDVREPGVGSRSMRERAEALSGTLELGPGEGGGTRVRAVIPL